VEVSEATEDSVHPWWRRVRAIVLLALLLTVLGVAVAAVIGVVSLAVAALLDQALG
jgi:hypothetical protein